MKGSSIVKKSLDRYLSPTDVFGMAFGCMVGWGAFVMPGTTFLPVAGPFGTLIALVLGTCIMLIIGESFVYLMNRTTRTGGVYTYTKEAFGRDHAFLSSWFLCLSYLTIVFLNGTALFLVIRTVLGDSVPVGYRYIIAGNEISLTEVAVSIAALGGVGLLFVLAKPILQRIQTILAIIMVVGIIVLSVVCLPRVFSGDAVWSFSPGSVNSGYGIFSIIILAPWAFVGFEIISFETAHYKFNVKKTRTIVPVSIMIAGFSYISMAVLSVAARPDGYSSWGEYIMNLGSESGVSSVPTFFAARSVMGPAGLIIICIAAVAAILTGIIGGYRAIVRVLSTMAEDRILSDKFSNTSFSILFIMSLSILISFLGRNTLNWFVDLTSLGAIIGFGYIAAAAFKIARTEGKKKNMILGFTGTAISVVFVIVQLVPGVSALEAMGKEAFLMMSLWCLTGFVFYWRTLIKSPLSEYTDMSTAGVVLFGLLVYSALMWIAKLILEKNSVEKVQSSVLWGGIILIAIIFAGLAIMIYIQSLVRKKHEASEREKIRAVEGSLAKSQFLFNMSHDIRTPMNAIIGYTELALKEDNTPVVDEYLGKIKSSSNHLLELINDILEMSRIESGKVELDYEPADLGRIFDNIKDLFSEQMNQKKIDFSVYYSQVKNRLIWCDRKNLNRVLLNVLSNAYKFTPEGGTITASVWETSTGNPGYGSYEIRVQDNGIGMSREFADKMFNAFERERTSTVSKIEGTGLGLSITKSIIDLMGGTIEVLTAPGNGTEIIFMLKFRLADEKDIEKYHQDEEDKASAENTDFSGRRLLLVEDNEINMEIANMILTQAGFAVETAQNGQIAVDMVKDSQPGYYDAVLMDIQMPVMDGYTAARTIRKLNNPDLADIPILAMTANAFKEDKDAAMESGMQAHIAKPIDIGVLMSTLDNIFKNK